MKTSRVQPMRTSSLAIASAKLGCVFFTIIRRSRITSSILRSKKFAGEQSKLLLPEEFSAQKRSGGLTIGSITSGSVLSLSVSSNALSGQFFHLLEKLWTQGFHCQTGFTN